MNITTEANSELLLLIKLKHPDPAANPEGYVNSLSDDYVSKNFYKSTNHSIGTKRKLAISYLRNLKSEKKTEYTDMMWNRLCLHYSENLFVDEPK